MIITQKIPATTSENALPAASLKAPAVQDTAKPVEAKAEVAKSASNKPASTKTTLKQSAPAKALAAKKASVKKAPLKKTPAKKAAVKRPLSNAFAPVKVDKAVKLKKPKLVRDSFTIPKAEYLVLDDLKQRATKLTRPAKKSELLRAGIKALAALSDAAFLTALAQVPTIKTGRPVSTS